jgi:hypothetical protein
MHVRCPEDAGLQYAFLCSSTDAKDGPATAYPGLNCTGPAPDARNGGYDYCCTVE